MSPNIYTDPEAYGLTAFGDVDFSSGCYEFDRLVVWTDQDGQYVYAEDSGCSCPEPFGSIDMRTVTRATPHEIAARLQAKAQERWDTYGDGVEGYGAAAMADLIGRLMANRAPAVTKPGKVLGYVVAHRDHNGDVGVDFAGQVYRSIDDAMASENPLRDNEFVAEIRAVES